MCNSFCISLTHLLQELSARSATTFNFLSFLQKRISYYVSRLGYVYDYSITHKTMQFVWLSIVPVIRETIAERTSQFYFQLGLQPNEKVVAPYGHYSAHYCEIFFKCYEMAIFVANVCNKSRNLSVINCLSRGTSFHPTTVQSVISYNNFEF